MLRDWRYQMSPGSRLEPAGRRYKTQHPTLAAPKSPGVRQRFLEARAAYDRRMGRCERHLVALVGHGEPKTRLAMCLLQACADQVSTPSRKTHVSGWITGKALFLRERSTHAPWDPCGPAGTLWQSLARTRIGTATHRQDCCYKVSRAKVSHPSREIRMLCGVLIC